LFFFSLDIFFMSSAGLKPWTSGMRGGPTNNYAIREHDSCLQFVGIGKKNLVGGEEQNCGNDVAWL
jgi:hypothetical protein